ncbi:MAG: Stp1/IreP family PP2C-type Ser/Thr phosphatase [Firmicutes bacterium]|nr:Stp1/IreP family PP2C-type Ser/Thr phosphatase [Bacillota bacterium]
MKACYMTDSGRVRSHNEDSVTILKNANDEYLLVVADGMGGHRKGEVASSIVVSRLGKRFNDTPSIGTKLDAVNWLNDNINEINKEILEYGENNIDSKGLGTTVVVALLTKTYLIFGNLGDSSGYVIKNNKLHKVTKDHTLVNLLVDAGNLTLDEAKTHPKKNVLMKALGAAEKADLDIFDVDMESEAIMLCSDGLTNMLTEDQIEKVLIDEELEIEEKVDKLIKKCNARGGNDNISIAYLTRNGE